MSDLLPAHLLGWLTAGLGIALLLLATGAFAGRRMHLKIRHRCPQLQVVPGTSQSIDTAATALRRHIEKFLAGVAA